MTIKTEPIIEGRFNWIAPRVRTSFVKGEDAEAIYEHIKDLDLGNVWYDGKTKTLKGSNPFMAARIDTLLREKGIRVLTLYDLSRPEVMQMIEGNCYSDTPAFVARSHKDSDFPENRSLLKQIISIVEDKQGKVNFPFLVRGFDSQERYRIIPRDDFGVVEDERLDGKYDGERFNEVDKKGLPIFVKSGKRIWQAKEKGLSGLFSYGGLDRNSNNGNLSNSNDNGRVVLLSGEASGQNFEAQLKK